MGGGTTKYSMVADLTSPITTITQADFPYTVAEDCIAIGSYGSSSGNAEFYIDGANFSVNSASSGSRSVTLGNNTNGVGLLLSEGHILTCRSNTTVSLTLYKISE